MEHKITLLTMPGRIPNISSAQYSPWSNVVGPIDFTGAVTQVVGIVDDDDRFEHRFYSPSETQQTLAQDLTLRHGTGSTVLPAGTGLQSMVGGFIVGADGGRFAVMFLNRVVGTSIIHEVGERHTVMILPVARADGSLPVFDMAIPYRYDGVRGLSPANNSSLVYGLATPPLCFAEGTAIRTDKGLRQVQDLCAGDAVWTADAGLQNIAWAGMHRLGPRDLDLGPQRRPIRVAAGALGGGLPRRDLILSPQHRVLIRSRIAERMTGSPEVLVAIRHLVGQPGIEVMRDATGVGYCHLLLDAHHLLEAEGALAESLLPGPQAIRSLAPADRIAVTALTSGRDFTPARPILSGRQARGLLRRHQRHERALVCAD